MNKCGCKTPPFDHRNFLSRYLEMNSHYADVEIDQCKKCGTKWLKYLIEEEFYSESGRWWRVELPNGLEIIDDETARSFIESQTSCFRGGSYFRHSGKLFEGEIRIR